MRTPALHRLAREGTCFDLTYAANPVCVPSRYSLLTGHLPHRFDGPGGRTTRSIANKHCVCHHAGVSEELLPLRERSCTVRSKADG